jgi:chaperonin GroES
MPTTFTPLSDRVLIRRVSAEERTRGGLHIPDAAKDKPQAGDVVAVGVDAKNVRAGDRVIFGKYSGDVIRLDEVEHLIMKEEDILGVMSESPSVSPA